MCGVGVHTQESKDTWLKAADASTDCASSGPGNPIALSVPNTHRGRKSTGSRKSERKWERVAHSVAFFLDSHGQISTQTDSRRTDRAKALSASAKKGHYKERLWQSCQDQSTVVRKQFSNLAICSHSNLLSACVSKYCTSKHRTQTTTLWEL